MGLDMHLTKVTTLGYNFREFNGKVELKIAIDYTSDNYKTVDIDLDRVYDIHETAIVWRKANQIHKWFVDNIQDGIDDCRDSYVEEFQLKELLAICEKVLTDKSQAKEFLPTQDGFFFGDTDYDEYYFEEIERTIASLKNILNEDNTSSYYLYQAIW